MVSLQSKSCATTNRASRLCLPCPSVCVCVSAGGRFSSGDRRHIPVRVCQQKRKASFRLPFLFLV